MYATLTAPIPHAADLIQCLSYEDDNPVNAFDNVCLTCSDGNFMTSGLLLAAVSPLLRTIGRQKDPEADMTIFLPDYTVGEMVHFVQLLTSPVGPIQQDEDRMFSDILTFLGQEVPKSNVKLAPSIEYDSLPETKPPTTPVKAEPSEETDEDDDWFPDRDEDEEEEEDSSSFAHLSMMADDGDYYDENQYNNENTRGSRRPPPRSMKKGGKFTIEVMKSYDETRRIFVCRQCGAERKRSDRLAIHLKWHEDHPGDNYQTRNNCKICGRFNATFFMLKMHMTRMHTDMPKNFNCSQEGCAKAFRFKGELKIHSLTHSKERNFVCTECGEMFRSKGQVELHATRRHNPDMKPTIPCEECGKLFRIQADLRNHLSRTHKARLERTHRCIDCDLTFRSEKSLLSHMSLHDPSRPLQCSRCTLRYKNKDALVAHEKTHDNAQFACEYCSMAFKRKDNLKRHVKSKHGSLTMLDKLMLSDDLLRRHEEQMTLEQQQ